MQKKWIKSLEENACISSCETLYSVREINERKKRRWRDRSKIEKTRHREREQENSTRQWDSIRNQMSVEHLTETMIITSEFFSSQFECSIPFDGFLRLCLCLKMRPDDVFFLPKSCSRCHETLIEWRNRWLTSPLSFPFHSSIPRTSFSCRPLYFEKRLVVSILTGKRLLRVMYTLDHVCDLFLPFLRRSEEPLVYV